MTDLAQIQAQALHDARRQLEAVRVALGAPEGADLADFATRLQAGAVSTIAALSDYAVHTERCSWDTRGDAESVCDCGLEELLRGAPALDTAPAELQQCRTLLATCRRTIDAVVHQLEVGEASDLVDGTIRPTRACEDDWKRAAADLTWVRVELRTLLRALPEPQAEP